MRHEINARIEADYDLLRQLRDEIRPLRGDVRRIQPRTTTAISLVGTDGGNNKIQFDPFLLQLVRVVDFRHSSPDVFASQLRLVWTNIGVVCEPGAKLVVRFGGINDRKADPLSIIKLSLAETGFELQAVKLAGSASSGKRQALHFSRPVSEPRTEHDVWATWCG